MKRKKFEKILSINLFFDVYHNSKLIERYHEYGEIALIFRKEIEQLLKETGFYDIKLYGNFDRSEYKKSSKKLL